MRSALPGSAFSFDGIASFVLDPHIASSSCSPDLTREIHPVLDEHRAGIAIPDGEDRARELPLAHRGRVAAACPTCYRPGVIVGAVLHPQHRQDDDGRRERRVVALG